LSRDAITTDADLQFAAAERAAEFALHKRIIPKLIVAEDLFALRGVELPVLYVPAIQKTYIVVLRITAGGQFLLLLSMASSAIDHPS
jgi:hypothetical protein